MAQLMLVNPRRKRRQKMTAKQAKFFGPRRKRAKVARNPKRARKARSRVRRNPIAAAARRYGRSKRRSLSLRSITSGGVLKSTVAPAAIGAVGAVALDALWAMLPVPASLKVGAIAVPAKAAGVLALGAIAANFLPKQRKLIEGAVAASLTIAAYNFVRAQVGGMFPDVRLGTYIDGYDGDDALGYTGAAPTISDNGMGTYLDSADPGVAWADAQYGDQVF